MIIFVQMTALQCSARKLKEHILEFGQGQQRCYASLILFRKVKTHELSQIRVHFHQRKIEITQVFCGYVIQEVEFKLMQAMDTSINRHNHIQFHHEFQLC